MMNKLQCCILCLILLSIGVNGRHTPRFSDLDEDEQVLFRAAYDTSYDTTYETPAYDSDAQDDDHGKFDLIKDGIWAIKSEMKVLKAFNKAFAANLLATKLKLKGLKKNLLFPVLEHHHHTEPEHKPTYHYQTQTYPASHQYEQAYAAPQPQYQAPHQPQYQAPAQVQYQAPAQPHYQAPAQPQYQTPQTQYSPAAPQYQAQQHDPYYGI